MMNLTYKPKNQHILGRIIDFEQSTGGIVLPNSAVKNVTVLVLVDQVGPDVKNCKVGDVVLYLKMNHVFLRDGTHFAQLRDEDVICTVEGLDPKLLVIEGGGKRVDGQPHKPTPHPNQPA